MPDRQRRNHDVCRGYFIFGRYCLCLGQSRIGYSDGLTKCDGPEDHYLELKHRYPEMTLADRVCEKSKIREV